MVVRMRSTRAHTGKRRSHHRAEIPHISKDQDGVHIRHRVDPKVGKYRGKQVLKTEEGNTNSTNSTKAPTTEREENISSEKESK
ncbi:MAG: 50S ribosomal protein L32 [Candidatus Paceibacterota bacterium]